MKRTISIFFIIYTFSGSIVFAGSLVNVDRKSTYNLAVHDASIVKKGEIARNLISINAENESLIWNHNKTKILVVSWKSNNSYEQNLKPYKQTSENEEHVVWGNNSTSSAGILP